jgi:hypothetical protein
MNKKHIWYEIHKVKKDKNTFEVGWVFSDKKEYPAILVPSENEIKIASIKQYREYFKFTSGLEPEHFFSNDPTQIDSLKVKFGEKFDFYYRLAKLICQKVKTSTVLGTKCRIVYEESV